MTNSYIVPNFLKQLFSVIWVQSGIIIIIIIIIIISSVLPWH